MFGNVSLSPFFSEFDVEDFDPKVDATNLSAKLDEIKMTVRKDNPAIIKLISSANAQEAFDQNTNIIMQTMVAPLDDATERILKQYFGGLCQEFAYSTCKNTACKKLHKFPAVFTVRAALEGLLAKTINEAYGVTTKNSKMLEEYFTLFAELFIKHDKSFENRLARMIMDCEKTPRLTKLYRNIVDILVLHAQMPRYEAIKFVIKHHADSPIAQEIILDMIVDTGADLIRLLPYLQGLSTKRTIPINALNKIVANCLKFQDPQLPMFCLNNMLTRPREHLHQLDKDSVERFFDHQMLLVNTSEEREQKLESLVKKFV